MQKEKMFFRSLWDSIYCSKIVQDTCWCFTDEPDSPLNQMYRWAELCGIDKQFKTPDVFDGYPESFVFINWKNMPKMENIDPIWKNNTLIDQS